ncbi:hypothetical protein CPC08DRAFT_773712 [Agrocybe pediades]|nr:hypothetical protein CPC08DRAFT_773712 [Agrocybe pediades]
MSLAGNALDHAMYPISEQKAGISSSLNSILVQQLLFGIYTGVFGITIYLDYHRQRSKPYRNPVVMGTLIALYVLTVLVVFLYWKYANQVYVDRGDARFLIYQWNRIGSPLEDLDKTPRVLLIIASFGGFILADGLLVWRCFHACGRSYLKCFLPIAFFIIEAMVLISVGVYMGILRGIRDWRKSSVVANRFVGSTLVSAAVTSLMATVMICRQIYKYTRTATFKSSGAGPRYKRLLLTLIHSASVYSVAVCIQAVVTFTTQPIFNKEASDGTSTFIETSTTYYSGGIISLIVGLVPTLMVAFLVQSTSDSNNDTEDLSSGSMSFPLDINLEELQLPSQGLSANGTVINFPDCADSEGFRDDERDSVDVRSLLNLNGAQALKPEASEPS